MPYEREDLNSVFFVSAVEAAELQWPPEALGLMHAAEGTPSYEANKIPTAETSDGSSADYYVLPDGATQLQDLISYRNMNAQDGEMFRALYRKGRASHSGALRDAKKILFYAQAEVDRLEKYGV
jgi:hypothetical protein